MKSCASLHAIAAAAAAPGPSPMVMIDGSPEPRLSVREWRVTGPLDERAATVMNTVGSAFPAALLDRAAAVVLPLRLSDGQVRLLPLVHGKLARSHRGLSSKEDAEEFDLVDAWTEVLSRPLSSSGEKVDRLPPGNVEEALQTLSSLAGLDISTRLILHETRRMLLVDAVDPRRPLGETLRKILDSFGLMVRRELAWEAGGVVETRAFRPSGGGARVALGWPTTNDPIGRVLSISADRPDVLARRWIAQAGGWKVESTFSLVGGWDPALQGQDDAAYERGSDAFPANANVYRLWALNEDASFTAAPFLRGPAFDLASLFEEKPIQPQALRFLPCVTLDDIGMGRPPRVEVSLDSGSTWAAYSGTASIRTERAAVYLQDSLLPTDFLASAKAGAARVRVTASLQSPVPVQALRWRGNPFVGTDTDELFDVSDAFAFRRVAASSLYHAQVVAGTAKASESDPTDALDAWLVDRMRRDALSGEARGPGRATLVLAGVWPLLSVGDRLGDVGGNGVNAAGRAEAIGRRGAVVDSVRCRWSAGSDLPSNRAMDSTVVELRF